MANIKYSDWDYGRKEIEFNINGNPYAGYIYRVNKKNYKWKLAMFTETFNVFTKLKGDKFETEEECILNLEEFVDSITQSV